MSEIIYRSGVFKQLTSCACRLYPAEITPLDIRAPANAISTTANWIFNFMVVMVTVSNRSYLRRPDLRLITTARGFQRHQMEDVPRIRSHQRLHGPMRLLLLPGDGIPKLGGDGRVRPTASLSTVKRTNPKIRIFHQAKGLRGALTVVKIAREQPHRYGKNGELLIAWEDTDDARDVERRRSSIVPHGAAGATEKFDGSTFENGGEKREHI